MVLTSMVDLLLGFITFTWGRSVYPASSRMQFTPLSVNTAKQSIYYGPLCVARIYMATPYYGVTDSDVFGYADIECKFGSI